MQRSLATVAFLLGLSAFALLGPATDARDQKKDKGDKNKGDKGKADDGVVTNWGKPKNYAPDKVNAFWLWYSDDVWHLRTTGGGKGAHQFKGLIEVVGGKLDGLKGKNGEYRGKNVDRYRFNGALTAIAFDFKADEAEDGLNFSADAAATTLRFTLSYDGEAAPKAIRIGHDGDHPSAAVFTVPAHPVNAKGK